MITPHENKALLFCGGNNNLMAAFLGKATAQQNHRFDGGETA
jgi:hypothetical protein